MSETTSVLTPGESIRPHLDNDKVKQLVKETFGLTITEITELNSYDDKNYRIQANHSSNPNIHLISKDGYVLKVLNSLDSKYTEAVEAQNEMILLTHSNGVPTARPLPNLYGQFMSLQNISPECTTDNRLFVVRLFEYIPGKLLHGAPYTAGLMYDIGRLAGRIDSACKNFRPPAYETHKRIWSLTEVPKLEQFINCVTDPNHRFLAESVIKEFKKQVVSQYKHLQKGVIHGDFNEQNILIRKTNDDKDHEVAGILDFGDSTCSYYVFELGVLLMYMILECNVMDAFETAGHALAGYLSEFDLPPRDLDLLKECIAGRLTQSLIMGTYSAAMDPDNADYLLLTAPKGWACLQRVWNTSKEDMYHVFQRILLQYNLNKEF